MASNKEFILWGSSGHAKVLINLIKSLDDRVVALFDNDPHAVPAYPDIPLYIGRAGFDLYLSQHKSLRELYGLVAIGGARGEERQEIHRYFQSHHIHTAPLIHPQASVCKSAFVGLGAQVLAGAVVASDARVGEACIINHGAILDHESELGNGVHLAPNATVCGSVKIAHNTLIGAGAVVLPRISIGGNVIVGAGAVVTHNLPSNAKVAGNPARAL